MYLSHKAKLYIIEETDSWNITENDKKPCLPVRKYKVQFASICRMGASKTDAKINDCINNHFLR